MSSSIFRIEVAPLTPLPIHRSPLFSYRSSVSIPPGSLVAISFGRRHLHGIVFTSKKLPGKAPLWMKPITEIIAPAWLTQQQQDLAQTISETYFSSLGNTLKHFVFSLPKTQAGLPLLQESKRRVKKKSSLGKFKTVVQNCVTDTLFWEKFEKRLAHPTRKGTVLILVPNLILAELLAKQHPDYLLITSRLSKKKLLEAWNILRLNQPQYVIGTRQALFAPFTNLVEIIMLFPEETLSYKQWDMTPHYNALSVAQMLCQLFGSTFTLLTTSLSLREQQLAHKKEIYSQSPLPILVDRRKDGKGARSRAFAKALQDMLTKTPSDKKIMLLAKERGVSGIVLCRSCRAIARCPNCTHVLGEASDGHFRCLACGFISDLFPKCQQCSAMHFIPFGFGTLRVERETEKLLLGRRILRIDRDALSTAYQWKNSLKQIASGSFDVLITTHEIGTLLPLPSMYLIAMLEGDHVLRHPEYDSEERLTLQVRRLLAKLDPAGSLVIQTFTPEERVWQHISRGTWNELYASLQEERDLLGYPPTTAMIQLSPFAGVKGKLSTQGLEKKREALKELLGLYPTFRVPSLLIRSNTKDNAPRPSLIIKYPSDTPLPAPLITWIKQNAHELTVDRDPYQL